MLLFASFAFALDYTDDFSTDQGAWSGGVVVDDVLRIVDGSADFLGDPMSSFTVSARVRLATEGTLSLSAANTIAVDFTGPGAVQVATQTWPLPPTHLAWTPADDPVIEPGSDYWDGGNTLHCEVHYDGGTGTWFLYWTGEMAEGYPYRQIGVATSTDGKTWTKYAGNPVLTIDYDTTTVDGIHVHMPTVVQKSADEFHMFYSCYQNNLGNRICHATSPDGLAWTPEGVALDFGAEGEFDSSSLRMPDAWIDESGLWHMWYDGTGPDEHYGPTGYATSTDGYTWTKQGEILPFEDALQGLSTWATPYGLASFHNKDDYFRLATAPLGEADDWTDQGEVLRKGWGDWNDGYIQAPSVWVDQTTWKMWFNAYTYTDATERIGYAEASANPGGWMDIEAEWDGVRWTGSVDGAELSIDGVNDGVIRFTATGTAEVDEIRITGVEWPEDSGNPPAEDTADGGDTADSAPPEAEDTGDKPADGDEACGCQGGPSAGLAAVLLAFAARRSTRAR